jgi:solute carrier family 25 iron transporter 28/37
MQVLSTTEFKTAVKDASQQQLSKQKHLWRGVYSVILGAGPAHAVHFATYEFCKEKFIEFDTKLRAGKGSSNQLLATGAAGAIATFSHDALMTPFDGK